MFVGPRIVTDGLQVYLDAGNSKSYSGTGTTWNDLSPNNLHSFVSSGTTYQSGNLFFDGVGDYGVIPSSELTRLQTLTFEVWFYRTGIGPTTPYDRIFQKNGGYSGYPVFGYEVGDSEVSGLSVRFSYSNLINDNASVGFNSTINLNTWYCASTTIDDSNMVRNYLNGEYKSELQLSGPIYQNIDTCSIAIGDSRRFMGSIPIIKIYNRALSSNEILRNFNAKKSRFGL